MKVFMKGSKKFPIAQTQRLSFSLRDIRYYLLLTFNGNQLGQSVVNVKIGDSVLIEIRRVIDSRTVAATRFLVTDFGCLVCSLHPQLQFHCEDGTWNIMSPDEYLNTL